MTDPVEPRERSHPRPHRRREHLVRAARRGVLGAALAATALAVVGAGFAAWFVQAGVYDVSAISAHTQSVYSLLEVTMRQSVRRRAREIEVPDLAQADGARRGAVCYRENCLVCHGAPGIAPGAIGKGLQPLPGPLADAARRWTPAELYWITRHGIKMSGMPAWQYRLPDADLWAVVAHVRTLGDVSPAAYAAAVAPLRGESCDAPPEAVGPETAASASADTGIDRGRVALRQYACSSCHTIPGVTGSPATPGPPLAGFARRGSIAGRLPATRAQLVAFIRHPQRLKPGSAMPELGVTEAHAQDMADYLLALK